MAHLRLPVLRTDRHLAPLPDFKLLITKRHVFMLIKQCLYIIQMRKWSRIVLCHNLQRPSLILMDQPTSVFFIGGTRMRESLNGYASDGSTTFDKLYNNTSHNRHGINDSIWFHLSIANCPSEWNSIALNCTNCTVPTIIMTIQVLKSAFNESSMPSKERRGKIKLLHGQIKSAFFM